MSESIISEAKSIRDVLTNGDVRLVTFEYGEYEENDMAKKLSSSIFTVIKGLDIATAENEKEKLKVLSLAIIEDYRWFASRDRIKEDEHLSNKYRDLIEKWNKLVEQYENDGRERNQRFNEIKKDYEMKLKEKDERILELIEQYATMKGRFEHCAEELKRILDATKPPK